MESPAKLGLPHPQLQLEACEASLGPYQGPPAAVGAAASIPTALAHTRTLGK
jgi:hypothetical protein